jgi:hypothetical protein
LRWQWQWRVLVDGVVLRLLSAKVFRLPPLPILHKLQHVIKKGGDAWQRVRTWRIISTDSLRFFIFSICSCRSSSIIFAMMPSTIFFSL